MKIKLSSASLPFLQRLAKVLPPIPCPGGVTQKKVTLVIQWGSHELTAPVELDVAS
ncbi:MAG: hypothetical protein ACE5JI_03290 [Acidobacteriota bacterium]